MKPRSFGGYIIVAIVQIALGLLFVSCASRGPVAPTPATPTIERITYTINVPLPELYRTLADSAPHGILLNPIEAQARYDFSAAYGGSPNVYYGELAPPVGQYQNAAILVAPRSAASKDTFTSADWPGLVALRPGVTYGWIGFFEYTQPGRP